MPRVTATIESSYSGIVVGIDEAGCGPWAGPVVAAAVILNPHRRPPGINDSKQLTAEEREALYKKLMSTAHCTVGIATVSEIDTLNILQAAKLAMCRAYEQLGVAPEIALIDGNRPPTLPCPLKAIVGGDGLCFSIAAAGIIAKVTRDRMMRELAREFPGYGWERNAGYGTPEHQKALLHHGVTPHHRRSFAPIQAMLEATDLFAA